MEKEYEPIVKNLTEARNMYFKDVGCIIDYFFDFKLKKVVCTDNKYSKYPWIDFELKIYPSDMSKEDMLSFISLNKKFDIRFDEGCIFIYNRYYIKEVEINYGNN